MSVKGYGNEMSLIAGVDFSAAQYRLVRLTANRTVGLGTAATNDLIGVSQDKVPANAALAVKTEGHTKVQYGATVTAGQYLTSDANGRAIPATTGRQIIGIAVIGGANLDLGEMLITTRALFP